jgi:4-hydroxybenzoyl-CoA reductase beta subunit
MILFDFQYERARSVAEAATLLAELGSQARVMAGGTDLLPNMRTEVAKPATVVGLSGIAAAEPQLETDGSIRIDALMRLAALAESPLIVQRLPMLAQAARAVASNQIRQMGTLGGNLCQETRCLYYNQKHDYQFVAPCYKRAGDCCYPFPQNKPDVCWSVYMSDVAPALIALGADICIVGADGKRRMPLADLYSGDGLKPLTLKPNELIESVVVPALPAGTGWGYHKSARRGGLEFAISVIGLTLKLDTDGCCRDARIVIGAVREGPVRASAAEQALIGQKAGPEAFAAAAKALSELNPLPHHGFTKSFIVDNMRVYLRRVLAQAAERVSA